MDPELVEMLGRALRDLKVRLTPRAQILLYVVLDSIADHGGSQEQNVRNRRQLQVSAIDRVPAYLAALGRARQTEVIDAFQMLQAVPRAISDLCPWEYPP